MRHQTTTCEICDKVTAHKEYNKKATPDLKKFISTTNRQLGKWQSESDKVRVLEIEIVEAKKKASASYEKLNSYRDATGLLAITCDINI